MRCYTVTSTQSMNASFTSTPYTLEHMEGFSVCLSWTESVVSLVGTFVLQACNNPFKSGAMNSDGTPIEDAAAVWVDITGSDQTVAGAGTKFINIDGVYYNAFRVKWTRTSGQGSVTFYAHARGTM